MSAENFYSSRFKNSIINQNSLIERAHEVIECEGLHPLLVFDAETQLSDSEQEGIETRFGQRFPYSYFRVQPNEDVAERFLFPEPAELLTICLHLGVHPADLMPANRESPAPRSIVQLCKSIADDPYYPEQDRIMAYEFILAETQAIEQFQQEQSELWAFILEKGFLVEQSTFEVAEIQWRPKPNKGIKSRKPGAPDTPPQDLSVVFADLNQTSLSELSSYPMAPDALSCREARSWDRKAIADTESKLAGPKQKKDQAWKKLEQLGDKVFGKGNTREAYNATKKLARDLQPDSPFGKLNFSINYRANNPSFVPQDAGYKDENELNVGWLTRCRNFRQAEIAFDKQKADLDSMVGRFNEAYDPKRFSKSDFDRGLSFFENYVIIDTEDHIVPNLDVVSREF